MDDNVQQRPHLTDGIFVIVSSGKVLVADRSRRAVDDEHAGGLPVGEGVSGDELGRKLEVEI